MEKFILDTNVVSELRKRNPNKGCAAWIAGQSFENLYLTVITLAEIVQGIALNDQARERGELQAWLDEQLVPQFGDRILPFDQRAARIFGNIAAEARRRRKTRPLLDSLIAAIALAHDCAIVTRNRADFTGLDLTIVNPWK